jgi:hypothetical protein
MLSDSARHAVNVTPENDLRVIEIDFRSDPRWNTVVEGHPAGSIFHHSTWLESLEREYRREPLTLACEDGTGQLQGLLPLITTKGFPFGVGGAPAGRRLSSLPRSPIAGPLATTREVSAALIRAAIDRVRDEPALRLEVKANNDNLDGIVPGFMSRPWRLTFTLDLTPAQLRFGSPRNHRRLHWSVKKAKRHGVIVRDADAESDLRNWYELYLHTMRDQLVPPRPYRFFAALWDLLRPHGFMRLVLAERLVSGRRTLLAGSLFLSFRDTISYTFTGGRAEHLWLRPNDIIQWETIHDARDAGYRRYDFGEVVEHDDGLTQFKSKWGTEPSRLYRYYYPPAGDVDVDSSHARYRRLLERAWQRVPLGATSRVGDRVYGYL